MSKKKLIIPTLLLLFVLLLAGCANTLPVEGDRIRSANYKLKSSWLAQPENPDKAVDVFCLYLTAWARENDQALPLSSILDTTMKKMLRL